PGPPRATAATGCPGSAPASTRSPGPWPRPSSRTWPSWQPALRDSPRQAVAPARHLGAVRNPRRLAGGRPRLGLSGLHLLAYRSRRDQLASRGHPPRRLRRLLATGDPARVGERLVRRESAGSRPTMTADSPGAYDTDSPR